MIRSTDELIDKIAEELIWRRKELTDLRSLVQSNLNTLRSRVLIRSAIALLYAHWEGFVKITSSHYLEYVASNRVPYKDLTPNFVALALRKKFVELSISKKISGANTLANFFCTELSKQSNVPYKKIIDTKSNLSSAVLTDIIDSLGLSDAQFKTKYYYIDHNLVNPRNHVAHGESLTISVDDYLLLHDEVISLIELFRNEIENSAVQKLFIRK